MRVPTYIPAYDTEAIYPWWELGEQAYSPDLYRRSVSYAGDRLRECLSGICAVARVHEDLQVPATFFLVARLVEAAPTELREILDRPLFDLQCHGYTHDDLLEALRDPSRWRHEIVDSKMLIEDTFNRPVVGFTTPGAYYGGLRAHPSALEALSRAGYRYVRSFGRGLNGTLPAPLTQPFWYAKEGFPNLLELSLHGWHDNVLAGQPFPVQWPPILPWGYPAQVPSNALETFQAYAQALEFVRSQGLKTFVPCFHPWSIHRVSPEALHLRLILTLARQWFVIATCTEVYTELDAERQKIEHEAGSREVRGADT